jgi:hypothetical protein
LAYWGWCSAVVKFAEIVVQRSADEPFHLTFCWKPAETFLGKDQYAVDRDLIYPAAGGNQFDLGVIFLFQFGFQPGSARFVVSGSTIFDRDFHWSLLDWPPA